MFWPFFSQDWKWELTKILEDLKLGSTTKLSCKKVYISRSPSTSLVAVRQYFLFFHSWFMKKAHLNKMTWRSEFLAFFNCFPTNVSNLNLDFGQLTKGCNLIDERYAFKSGIFRSLMSPPWEVSHVPKNWLLGGW